MKKYNKGFTLIELLVVIAIIGILASIVLVSLNTARQKGKDASLKGSISSARAQAEIIFDNANGSYASVCTDAGMLPLLSAAAHQNGALDAGTNYTSTTVPPGAAVSTSGSASRVTCSVDVGGTAYVIAAYLNGGQFFCVDSTGYANQQAGTNATNSCI